MNVETTIVPQDEPAPPRRSRWPLALALLVVALLLLTAGAAAVLARLGRPFIASPFNATQTVGVDSDNPAYLTKLAGQAVREIEKVHPKGTYIVVDTYRNRLSLIENGTVIQGSAQRKGMGLRHADGRAHHSAEGHSPGLGEA
ncbi:MAG: hypothetical protein B7Z68_08210 [Acidobacteria bacterium 21-70-11]|nr:MAG: hypothetical protein B7Z68_08210 [Acidobacteria bacterium 21-70-11]